MLTHPGYVPAAWADDGTLEAMEDPGAAFRLAVQWHPEDGDDPRLFEALVAAACRMSGPGPDHIRDAGSQCGRAVSSLPP